MQSFRFVGLIMAAAMVFTAGCGSAGQSSVAPPPPPVSAEETTPPDKISVPWFENDTLNPYSCETLQNYYLAGLLCDPLVALSPDQIPQHRLALDITTENNLTFIISLRHDAVFSDGTPLTGEDVLFSLELARLSPRFAPALTGVATAEAIDSGTVRITLTSPDLLFPRCLTFPIIKKDTGDLPVPVGVGRFLLNTDQQALIRNDSYYSPAKNLRQLSLVATTSLEEQSYAIMEGKIDLMYSDLQGDLNLGLGIGYRQIPLSNMVYLGINGGEGHAGAQTVVRQALSGLIDRDEISRKVYMGFAASTSLPVNPSMAQTTLSSADLEVNREKQYGLLRQAGYTTAPDGSWQSSLAPHTPLRLELLVNEDNDERVSAAELIARMYKEAGIPVTIVPLPFAQYSERITKGEYDLYIGEVRLAYNMDISQLIFPGGSLNPAAPSLPALSAAYNDVKSGKSKPEVVEERLRTDLPVIPLLFRRGILCFSRDFSANIVATEQDIFYNINEW